MLQQLFASLHTHPELSSHEQKTRSLLWDFLQAHTSLELSIMAGALIARHQEGDQYETIAIRGDMDAIMNSHSEVYHGCGHDGHSTILAGLGLALENRKFQKNIILIFQPAEEIGQGALPVALALKPATPITRIYGIHNIPGFPENTILLRSGTMACASMGMTIKLTGRQSHAAYPNQGQNPAPVLAQLVVDLPELITAIAPDQTTNLLMATIVNLNVGEKNFGINPGVGELSLTLRAYFQSDLAKLKATIEQRIIVAARKLEIAVTFEYQDEFPDTINDPVVVSELTSLFEKEAIPYEILAEPMRWSEDFGHFLHHYKGAFLGIGAGSDQPGLHLDDYQFNAKLIEPTIATLLKIIETN